MTEAVLERMRSEWEAFDSALRTDPGYVTEIATAGNQQENRRERRFLGSAESSGV